MTNFQDISASIVTKLGGISGLNGVYDYEIPEPTSGKYPFATVTPKAIDGLPGDLNRNIRTYSFSVRVYQERTAIGAGNSKAERLIREMTDEITTAFDADITLSGRVLYVKPIKGDFSYVDREIGDTRIAEFTIETVNAQNALQA